MIIAMENQLTIGEVGIIYINLLFLGGKQSVQKKLIMYKKWISVVLTAILLILFIPQIVSANTEPHEGKLVNGQAPLAHITFSFYSTGENQVWYDFTTNENGAFTYNLPDGEYKIDGVWVDPTWYILGKTFTIQNGLIDGQNAFVINVLDYENPADQWNVAGTLMNGSIPMTNTTFSIHQLEDNSWYDTKSDETGKYHFMLPDGTYQLDGIWDSIEAKWYPLNQTFSVKAGKLEGSTELSIDVAVAIHSDNVTGILMNGANTLSDLTFSIRTTSGEEKWYDTQTDRNGHYGLYLPNGTYMIEGIWDGTAGKWYVLQKEFTVAGPFQLNIDVITDGPVALQPNVSGVLKKGNEVFPNTVFSVHTNTGEETWYDTASDANGNFKMTLPNGSYTLEGIWDDTEGKWYSLQKVFTVDGTKELVIDVLAPQTILATEFSGTEANPKIYIGNIIVDASDVAKLENAIVKGNFTIKGNTSVEIVNVTVEGDTIFED